MSSWCRCAGLLPAAGCFRHRSRWGSAEIPVESGAVGENRLDAHGAAGELVKPLAELVDVFCRVGNLPEQRLGDQFQPNDLVGPPAGDLGQAGHAEVVSAIQSRIDQPVAHPGGAGHAPAHLEFSQLGAPAPVVRRWGVPWQVKNAAAPAADGEPELCVVGVLRGGQRFGVPLVERVLKACLIAVGVKTRHARGDQQG